MSIQLPNLEFLRTFNAVAELRVLKKASERLGLTPSAVSQALSRLESQLGVELFEHDVRPLKLTPAGARLLEESRPLVAAAEQLASQVSSRSLKELTLRLGIGETATATIGPWLVAGLMDRVRKLETQTLLTKPLIEELRKGTLDAIISPDALLDEDRWTHRALYEEDFVVAASKEAPLPKSEDELRLLSMKHPFITYARGSSDETEMARILRSMNIFPLSRVSAGSSYLLVGLVAQRRGWTIIPPTNLWCGRQFLKDLHFAPLPGGRRAVRTMWAVCSRNLSEAEGLVAGAAKDAFREHMIGELRAVSPELAGFCRAAE
jgi:DNA-binding transcriptional LysR family regulator